MSKVLQPASGLTGTNYAASTTYYGWVGHAVHGGAFNNTTVEARAQITYRSAGILSNLYFYIRTNGVTATSTFRTRINGANGQQSVSIGSSATGAFEDTTNIDTIASGDEVCYQAVIGGSGTSMSVSNAATHFDNSSSAITRIISAGSISFTFNATSRTFTPGAVIEDVSADNDALNYLEWNVPGTLSNLFVYIVSNSRTTTTTFKDRKNSSDGSLSVSVTAAATGVFEDTSNTTSVSAGDQINFRMTTGSGSSEPLTVASVSFEFSADNQAWHMGAKGGGACSAGQTLYSGVGGRRGIISSTDEAHIQTPARVAFLWSRLWIYVSANSLSSTSNVTVRKNAADTSLLVAIASSTTGMFEDLTHMVLVASGDLIDYKISAAAGTGSMTPERVSSVGEFNLPPNAPTLVSPAAAATIYKNQTNNFDWDFLDPNVGDTQSAWMIRRRVR